MQRSFLVIHIVLGLMALSGCADRYVSQCSTGELIELVGDREQADRLRLGVLAEVSARPLTGEQQKKLGGLLAQVAKSPIHSPMIRQQVIDMIVTKYPEEAAVWLSEALIETREPAIRAQILEHLERLDDSRALPGLIVALSEEQAEINIPTRGAGMPPGRQVGGVIVKIADDSLENVLASHLMNKGDDTLQVRSAALLRLVRYRGKEKAKEILSGAGEGDAFLEPLRFWAEHFGYVPETKSQVLMCQMQWLRLTAKQKEKLQQRARSLQGREGYRFEIADSHVLLEAEQRSVARSGDTLRSAIGKRLGAVAHTKRPRSYRGAADDYREDFIGQGEHLSYTDLLRIRLLLHALESEPFIGQLRQYLQEDLADVETEVGGLSFLQAGRIAFRAYPPVQRRGDNQYHESPEMIAEGVLCLARWHCHADPHQERTDQADWSENYYNLKDDKGAFYGGLWKGASLAGPGVDDMGYVQYFCCPLLVVTYIDQDTFNMDFVSAGGIVVDLGNY